MQLEHLVTDIANILGGIDAARPTFKSFQPGVGPCGEPQLLTRVVQGLSALPGYRKAQTKRTPDILIPGAWALEFKLARPFGDNGREAEDWSVNLLHPYAGNVSLIGDCLKLERLNGSERKGAVVIGYEHNPTQIALEPLFRSFEVIASQVMHINLGPRVQVIRRGLVHPVHQQLTVAAWEVKPRPADTGEKT